MDERTARKLRAAAEHERRVAGLAAEGLARTEAKAERDRARLDEGVAEARRQAEEAEERARAAEDAVAAAGLAPGVVDGDRVEAGAEAAEGRGDG